MEPEIVQRPKMILAGVIDCGEDVRSIDIEKLWGAYEKSEPGISKRIEGDWYELHVGEKQGNGIYSVLAGCQVEDLGESPIEVSLRTLPAGKYAHFAHSMKDGGFDVAFANVEKWTRVSGSPVRDFGLQHYTSDFNPNNKDSVLHIYIPLDE